MAQTVRQEGMAAERTTTTCLRQYACVMCSGKDAAESSSGGSGCRPAAEKKHHSQRVIHRILSGNVN